MTDRTDGRAAFLPAEAWPTSRRWGLAVMALLFAGVVTLIGVLTIPGNAWSASDQRWSHQIFDFGHRHHALTTAANWVGHLTIPTVLRVITLIGAVLLWRRGRRTEAIWWSLTMIIGGALAIALRTVVARPRPHWPGSGPVVEGYTFPSGHAVSAAVFAGCVLVVLWPHLGRLARVGVSFAGVAFLAAVGVSRLLLGVHSVGDVVAAEAMAACLLLVAIVLGADPTVRRKTAALKPGKGTFVRKDHSSGAGR